MNNFKIHLQNKKPLLKYLCIGILILLGVLGVGFFITLQRYHISDIIEPGTDPCDLHLIGVRPDYSDDLFSPQGKRIGQDPTVNVTRTHWDPDKLQREFIFEIPVAGEAFKLVNINIYLNGNQGYALRPRPYIIKSRYKTRLVADAPLPRLSLRSKSRIARMRGGEPVKTVDIMVRYFSGLRGSADAIFSKPLRNEENKSDDQNKGYQLYLHHKQISQANSHLNLRVTATHTLTLKMHLNLHLTDGTWKTVRPQDLKKIPEGFCLLYFINNIGPEEITKITFNKKYYTKTFRDIVVHYRRYPQRTHAAYLDELGQRLHMDVTDPTIITQWIHQPTLDDPNDALRVLDIVRGWALLTASRTIRQKLTVDMLGPPKQERLRNICHSWVGTENDAHAHALGLWGNWPEFVNPSLERLTWTKIERLSERQMVSSFQYRINPTDEEIKQVTDFLLTCQTKFHPACQDLIRFIKAQVDRPVGQEALMRLAACDRSWIWTSIIQPNDVFTRLTQQTDLTETIKYRAVGLDVIDGIDHSDAMADKAYTKIASWLTPDLMHKEPDHFCRVISALARHGNPDIDTPTLIQFLEQQFKNWHLLKARNVEVYNHLGVSKVVTLINKWHRLNLGGLGSDLHQEHDSYQYAWRDIAESAIHWYQAEQHQPAAIFKKL